MNNKENTIHKNVIIGGISGMISRTCTAPFELLKIQQQNHFMKQSQWKQVLKQEGILGFWKGNFTNCIRIFPQSAINFAVYKKCQSYIHKENSYNAFISGTISGFVSMICIYPFENARTRLSLQMKHQYYTSLFDVFKKTKLLDLYRGLGVSLIGFPPYNAISFMTHSILKQNKKVIEDLFQNKYIQTIQNDLYSLLSGGLSGTIAVSLTYPTDLIRRRFQIQNMCSSVPKYKNLYDCLKQIIQNEGITGLYRGLGITYMKIFPTMAIQFYMFEKLQIIL